MKMRTEQQAQIAQIADMHTHYTIVDLAGCAAVLPLHRGGMTALFGMTGFVHSSDGLGMSVLAGHEPLDAVAHTQVIPMHRREESLKCSWRRLGQQGDRLDAFAVQTRHLTANIGEQMFSGLAAIKTVVKLLQKCFQFLTDVPDTLYIHADDPPNNCLCRTYRQNMFKFLSLSGAVILATVVESTDIRQRSFPWYMVFHFLLGDSGCESREFLDIVRGDQSDMANKLGISIPRFVMKIAVTAGTNPENGNTKNS